MKRLINVRAPLFLAVALILGIYSCYEWYFGNFYFALAVLLLLIALTVLFAIRKSRVWKLTVVMLVFVLLGFGISRLTLYRAEKREMNCEQVTLTGRVCDLNRNGSVNGSYYLEDCTLENGEKLHGRVQLREYGVQLQTGDIVIVSGCLSSTYAVKSKVESYLIRNNINYELTNAEVLTQKSGTVRLDERARKYIYDITHEYMIQNGDVMYALLTGDRSVLSYDVQYSFSSAGILHLLAVSGLHVGFIVALICFALKRLRLHPLIECAILLVPLLFYAYICAFTPSVMRAIVMVVCSYIARACYGKYDMLSAISWAALLILLVKPLYLFDVGFQLSFLSVYGISTVYSCIDRRLKRRKMNRFLRYLLNSLALSLSCVIATLFTVALNFGQVPVLGALLNVIVIPLVSVVFTLGIVGLIPSVFHYLLLVADYVLRVVAMCADIVSRLSFATVVVSAVAICTVIVVVALFAVGGFVNLGKIGKRIFYPLCVVALVCSMLFSTLPKSARNQAFVSVSEGSAAVAAVSQGGQAVLITDFNEYDSVHNGVSFLQKFKLTGCTLYISDCSKATAPALELVCNLPIDRVYILGADDSELVETQFAKRGVQVLHQLPNSTTGNTVKVQSYFAAGLVGVSIAVDDMDICVVYGDNDRVSGTLASGISADVFVLPDVKTTPTQIDAVTLTPYQSKLNLNYGANKYGNFTIGQKGGKMYLSFR